MRQTLLFAKTKKEAPKDAETISHKLLVRADFIEQSFSGVYRLLPLGWRVHKKIEEIIRQEMLHLAGQELDLPTLQNKNLWLELIVGIQLIRPCLNFRTVIKRK